MFLAGKLLGNVLGNLINIESDIGGVGFAMLLLMVSSMYLRKKDGWLKKQNKEFYSGALFTFNCCCHGGYPQC